MTASTSTPEPPSTAARVVSAFLALYGAFFWLVVLFVLVSKVPRFVQIYERFEIRELPTRTILVCTVGLFVARYWYVFGLAWFAATAAVAFGFARCKHGLLLGGIFLGVSFLATGVVIGVVVIGLFMGLEILIKSTGG